uniref:Queuosine 5'-phosphate N-glycosylase/hydrolase n=2 Tax=Parascaris univalens TaxID=6257 RepID=A0A915AU26_PARUN
MLDKGRLNPRETGKFICEHSDGELKVSKSGVETVAKMVLDAVRSGKIRDVDFDASDLHPKGADRAAIEWVFFMDSINFSFWTEEGAKFVVTYKDKSYTGYFAGCACVNRAIDNGIPITSADYMQNITVEDVKKVFVADDGGIIPMAEQRAQVLSEAGAVLNAKFGGSFYHCVENCGKSAVKLLATIVENFESYRDFGDFKGKKVSFLKRAQILVADVYGCLKNKNEIGSFYDIGELTMFADYRVPQALAYLGALHYSSKLLKSLRSNPILPSGCPLEMELRGFSIKACDDIVDVAKRLRTAMDIHLRTITAIDVDMFLWAYRREHAVEIEKNVPYHRVRSINY